MNATRRGFLASLLALPVVAKLLPKASPWPLTIKPLEMPININSGMADYAAMYHDRMFLCGRDVDPSATVYFSSPDTERTLRRVWDDFPAPLGAWCEDE